MNRALQNDTGYDATPAHKARPEDLPLFQPATDTRDRAFDRVRADAKKLSESHINVIAALKRLGPSTFQEIAKDLGWTVNRVIPRIAELRTMRRVEDAGKRQCKVTQQSVHTWRVNE